MIFAIHEGPGTICMYIHIYICVYVYMYISVCVCVSLSLSLSLFVYAHVFGCVVVYSLVTYIKRQLQAVGSEASGPFFRDSWQNHAWFGSEACEVDWVALFVEPTPTPAIHPPPKMRPTEDPDIP